MSAYHDSYFASRLDTLLDRFVGRFDAAFKQLNRTIDHAADKVAAAITTARAPSASTPDAARDPTLAVPSCPVAAAHVFPSGTDCVLVGIVCTPLARGPTERGFQLISADTRTHRATVNVRVSGLPEQIAKGLRDVADGAVVAVEGRLYGEGAGRYLQTLKLRVLAAAPPEL